MSGQLAALVGKRILNEHAKNHFGQEDPYFEEVPASRLNRAFGRKTQKRRKAVPPGLSENDAKVLTKVKRRAYRLDYSLFNLCGIQFGWSSVIAIIPFAGDAADVALALMVLRTCEEIDGGLPGNLRMHMMFNIMIDFIVGLVPFVGDIADALYKCNTRNAVLLEEHLRAKGARAMAKGSKQQQRVTDLSVAEEFDRYEDGLLTDQPNHPGQSASGARTDDGVDEPVRPQPAKTQKENRGGRGWFGGAKQPTGDLERGVVRNTD
ncbi:hypothetical protein DTO166G4_2670 [Paecilomyces variotii]|nr:hypothetical protein DTO164E3_2304 [Paecilomyces variotii]KAJ9215833.1 hypothetical protein DTO166G4_2670 [Paecilomyces variotii]KAJ9225856.1 hypothetical protein DTO169C6_1919 [Paecilomyces variotii]KAJ9233901.1 hypothetical protein DTO166G5_5393 [Paecilomyces variotii]KAJ9239733.1 hypothetical protein DTO169E5_4245 [Paecilomyces variotii]